MRLPRYAIIAKTRVNNRRVYCRPADDGVALQTEPWTSPYGPVLRRCYENAFDDTRLNSVRLIKA